MYCVVIDNLQILVMVYEGKFFVIKFLSFLFELHVHVYVQCNDYNPNMAMARYCCNGR